MSEILKKALNSPEFDGEYVASLQDAKAQNLYNFFIFTLKVVARISYSILMWKSLDVLPDWLLALFPPID